MRKWLAAGCVLAILVATPVIVLAATGHGRSKVNCQDVAWRTTAISTTSSHFSSIPGIGRTVSSIRPMSITVSAAVRGAPVAFRVRDISVAGNKVVPPGAVPFANGSHASSFSYTWTDPGISAAIRGHQFKVQWRRTSPTGTATLSKADLVVVYQTEPGSCQ
jgi:hypothetical protein